MRNLLALLIALAIQSTLPAQAPVRMSAAELHDAMERAAFLGSALYVAAHPDDENTSMIAYLANSVKAETAYLSLTRGDGGQNLIGPEIGPLLGVIRTQELLAARRVDGGRQFFSRANDFGYSKHPDETLRIWNEREVMGDLVWTVRKFRPDVIINRFDHDSAGRTHGHHTSSALLSVEAWDDYNDPRSYPEQLRYVEPYQPRRLFFNTSWWFYGSREAFAEADKSKMVQVDVGEYYPSLGLSNSEIAAYSRSQHKCQGMGRTPTRGSSKEYLELLKGDMPTVEHDLFAGINTTWSRVEGGAPIAALFEEILAEYDYRNPAASASKLAQAYALIDALPDGHWKSIKQPLVAQLIEQALGLYLEANADDYTAVPGDAVEVSLEAIYRLPGNVQLDKVTLLPSGKTVDGETLGENARWEADLTVDIPADAAYTTPYWLKKAGELGMYTVPDQQMRGLPETPRYLRAAFQLKVDGVPVVLHKDVTYKRTDPVKGEFHRPFELIPPVAVNLRESVYVFADGKPKTVDVVVRAGKPDLRTEVTLAHPNGWTLKPAKTTVTLAKKGEEATVQFELYPPAEQTEGLITPIATHAGESYTRGLYLIDYDHIPVQTVLVDPTAKVVRLDLQKRGERIGYVMGAGDKIPESLEQIGYRVDLLEDEDLQPDRLAQYDAIIMGVRAYNTRDNLKFYQQNLLDYVRGGGNLIVQYNTNRRLKVAETDLAPYPLKLSRDRVSVEEAEVRLLAPQHPVLNAPNKITAADFDGWVQERGLYFPNEWADEYTAILSSNDPGEPARDGGLLVAPHGEGHFVYTGYSWFRELPAGVPGAYRLFTNLLSL